jgi:hypothetical protein
MQLLLMSMLIQQKQTLKLPKQMRTLPKQRLVSLAQSLVFQG